MKIKNTTNKDEFVRDVSFPAGKTVDVECENLAARMINLPGGGFVEVKAKANVKNKA